MFFVWNHAEIGCIRRTDPVLQDDIPAMPSPGSPQSAVLRNRADRWNPHVLRNENRKRHEAVFSPDGSLLRENEETDGGSRSERAEEQGSEGSERSVFSSSSQTFLLIARTIG